MEELTKNEKEMTNMAVVFIPVAIALFLGYPNRYKVLFLLFLIYILIVIYAINTTWKNICELNIHYKGGTKRRALIGIMSPKALIDLNMNIIDVDHVAFEVIHQNFKQEVIFPRDKVLKLMDVANNLEKENSNEKEENKGKEASITTEEETTVSAPNLIIEEKTTAQASEKY